MHVVHEPAEGAPATLASDAAVADSFLSKARGLIGRSSIPESYGLVFEFGRASPRTIHMVGVRTPIDVLWLVDGTVERVETLSAWTGIGRARADTIVELAPGAAQAVSAGDRIRVEDGEE